MEFVDVDKAPGARAFLSGSFVRKPLPYLSSLTLWSAIARSTSVMSVVSDRSFPPVLVGLGCVLGYIGVLPEESQCVGRIQLIVSGVLAVSGGVNGIQRSHLCQALVLEAMGYKVYGNLKLRNDLPTLL